MRLEYQIASTGSDKLRQVMRGIDQEAAAQARRGVSRERAVASSKTATARTAETASKNEVKAAARAVAAKERLESRARTKRVSEEQRAADKIRQYEATQYQRHLAHQNRVADKMRKDSLLADRRAVVQRQKTATSITRGVGRGFSGAMGAMGTGVRMGAGLAAIGGTLAVGNAVGTQMSERAQATQLANQASNKADPELRDRLLKNAQGVRGFTGGEVLGGMSEFVAKTGDLKMAEQIIGSLGELSLATGADLGDLGATAGQAFNVLADQIEDPKQLLIELNSLMGALAQQGAMGAIEIRDLAGDFGKLGAATRSFQGGAPALLRTMGAFAQMAVARGGAEGSADASTASARLASDIVTNKKKFKGIGVDIKSKVDPTKLRDPLEIMLDVLDKTKGDVEKTSGLFGAESRKIFSSLSASYSEGEKKQKGSGRAAVEAEFARFAGAEMSQEDIRAKADLRAEDPDIQFKDAMRDFNKEIGEKLLPELTKLIPKLAELTPIIGDLVTKAIDLSGWLADNPLLGLGGLVAGFMVKELAMVGFSALFQKAIMGAMGAAGMGGGGMPGVDIMGGGAGAGAAGGKAAKAGKAARGAGKLGRIGQMGRAIGGSAAVRSLGMAGLAYGAFEMGQAQLDQQIENAQKKVDHEKEFGGGALNAHAGLQTMGGLEFSSAGLDANLQGSPAAIQQNFGAPGKAEPVQLDLSEFNRKIDQLNTNLGLAANKIASAGGPSNNRTTPILLRN